MGRQYYYLVAGLPELAFADKKMPIGVSELRQLLMEELHPDDRPLVEVWFLPFDHVNISNALFNIRRPFNTKGLYPQHIVEQLVDKKHVDELMSLTHYRYISDNIKEAMLSDDEVSPNVFDARLMNGYYQLLENSSCGFVRQYAAYDKIIRNVFAALNGRKFQLPFEDQLIGNDESIELLRKSRSRDFGLSADIDNIEALVALFDNDDLVERELKLDLMRWQFIDEAVFFDYFSIERVIAFLLKLMMVERWLSLDEEKGKVLFAKLLGDVEKGFSIPEEYKLSHGK